MYEEKAWDSSDSKQVIFYGTSTKVLEMGLAMRVCLQTGPLHRHKKFERKWKFNEKIA